MALLGTHRTLTTGVSAGVTPTATLRRTAAGSERLRLDLGNEVVEIALGANPRAEIEAIRDSLDTILKEAA